VPLNAIVLVVLLFLSEIDNSIACLSCAGLLGVAYFLQRKLVADLAFVKPTAQGKVNDSLLETSVPILERDERPTQANVVVTPRKEGEGLGVSLRDDPIREEGLSSREKGSRV